MLNILLIPHTLSSFAYQILKKKHPKSLKCSIFIVKSFHFFLDSCTFGPTLDRFAVLLGTQIVSLLWEEEWGEGRGRKVGTGLSVSH